MNRISIIEITVPGRSVLKEFCRKYGTFLKSCSKISGTLVLTGTVLTVILLFSSDVYRLLTTDNSYKYSLGGDMISYAAGFVRRGLFGEIVYSLNPVFQPFVTVLLMSSVSILFILYVLIARMIRLNVRLPYIMAITLSPCLILMHRGGELIRTDMVVMALNLAALCFLRHIMFHRHQRADLNAQGIIAVSDRYSFAGMIYTDTVLFTMLAVSALIHELSITLLPPLLLLFFIYTKRVHRTMHCVVVAAMLIALYTVMMAFFKFGNVSAIAESWSGIFPNYEDSPELWNNSPRGMAIVINEDYAISRVCLSMNSLPDFFVINLITAISEPFIILLLSGIRIFRSSSFRCRAVRWLIVISCLSPLCLSFVAYDYGRWYSFAAMQLTVYVLMLARPAGRISCFRIKSEITGKIISVAKSCLALAIMVHFTGSRLILPGYFMTVDDKDSFIETTREGVVCFPDLVGLSRLLLTKEMIMTP